MPDENLALSKARTANELSHTKPGRGRRVIGITAEVDHGDISTYSAGRQALVRIGGLYGIGSVAVFGKTSNPLAMMTGIGAQSGNGSTDDLLSPQGTEKGIIETHTSLYGPLVRIGTTTSGEGLITTYRQRGAFGDEIVSIGVLEGGAGTVVTHDAEGDRLVSLGATVDGEGSVAVFNRAGGVRAQWP